MMQARIALTALLALLGACAVGARHRDKDNSPSHSAPSSAPAPSGPLRLPPRGSGSCVVSQQIENAFSKLDVKGELNNHDIELDKKEEARPEGTIEVTLNIPCPREASELAEPFSFAMQSPSPLLIQPQEDLTIKAAKVVKVQVDKLQLMLRTPTPMDVDGAEFSKEEGLHMQVVSGTATAMGHSFELTGFETTVPFNGYFDLVPVGDGRQEMVLHLTDFFAKFIVKVDEPEIDGYFTVTGFISAFGAMPASLKEELAAHAARRVLRGLGARAAALAAAAMVAAVLVAAAVRSLRRRLGSEAQQQGSLLQPAAGSAVERVARTLAAGAPDAGAASLSSGAEAPSDSLAHVAAEQP